MKIFYFLPLFFFTCGADTGSDWEPIMIADVIRAMETPSSVISSVCWTSKKNVQLFKANKAIAGENVMKISMMQFLNPAHIPNLHILQEQHTVFLVDLRCPDIATYLQTNSIQNYFRSPFRWIIIDSDNSTQNGIIPEVLINTNILSDAEVVVIQQNKEAFYDLHLVYKISPESKWRTERYGKWNIQHRFQKTRNMLESTAIRRHNLNGYEIKICYVLTDNDSINHLTDEVNDHIDTITKVNFPTTNYLLDFLNASRKYVFVDTWGYRLNGSWNGMTGYLVRGEVEIGGSPMFFTSERISIVDYISSPTPTRSKFVFQQPKLSYESNLFILSFRTTVWFCSIALVFLLFLALLVVAMWEWKKTHHEINLRAKNAGILRANVADIVVLIFAAVCQQGSHAELKGSLGRIVMLLLFLALMFLYTSYSANIVALLQSSSSKIRTLDDLLHSRLKFGVHDTVFNRYYFSTATEPVRKAIYEKKVAPPGTTPRFMTMEEGIKKMQKGLFTFHMETGVGYKFVGKFFNEGEKCGLKEIQYLQVIDPWMAVKKNTPFKEMFKIGTKRIHEHGLQNRENRLLYARRPKCTTSNFVSVSMVDCYPTLLILLYGTVTSFVLLVIEILVHQRKTILKRIRSINKQHI